MLKNNVYFESEGLKCSGVLYLPESNEKRPVIVMAHGLGCIKEMRLDAFAARFQNAGYACLLFDYRYFGESEGQPRQLLDIKSQLKDWKAAIAYARKCEDVDNSQIILWGSSFSGGHVLSLAAEDDKIAAVISQCPFTDGRASGMKLNLVSNLKLGTLAAWDVVGSAIGRPPVYVKSAGKPSEAALMTGPDCIDGYLKLVPEREPKDRFQNKVAARFVFQIIRSTPGNKVPRIKCPILFCICDTDTVAPANKTFSYAKKAPKGEIKRYPFGHFDVYVDEGFETAVKDQTTFLDANLGKKEETS